MSARLTLSEAQVQLVELGYLVLVDGVTIGIAAASHYAVCPGCGHEPEQYDVRRCPRCSRLLELGVADGAPADRGV